MRDGRNAPEGSIARYLSRPIIPCCCVPICARPHSKTWQNSVLRALLRALQAFAYAPVWAARAGCVGILAQVRFSAAAGPMPQWKIVKGDRGAAWALGGAVVHVQEQFGRLIACLWHAGRQQPLNAVRLGCDSEAHRQECMYLQRQAASPAPGIRQAGRRGEPGIWRNTVRGTTGNSWDAATTPEKCRRRATFLSFTVSRMSYRPGCCTGEEYPTVELKCQVPRMACSRSKQKSGEFASGT